MSKTVGNDKGKSAAHAPLTSPKGRPPDALSDAPETSQVSTCVTRLQARSEQLRRKTIDNSAVSDGEQPTKTATGSKIPVRSPERSYKLQRYGDVAERGKLSDTSPGPWQRNPTSRDVGLD